MKKFFKQFDFKLFVIACLTMGLLYQMGDNLLLRSRVDIAEDRVVSYMEAIIANIYINSDLQKELSKCLNK
jgi:hypothetical protein